MTTLDALFRLLESERRRCLLRSLADADPTESVSVYTEDEQLALELNHVHLPKLEEEGLIEWEEEKMQVRRGASFDDVLPILAAIDTIVDRNDD